MEGGGFSRVWTGEKTYLDLFYFSVARRELTWEVDYIREANNCRRMRQCIEDAGLHHLGAFNVPQVHDEVSGSRVLAVLSFPPDDFSSFLLIIAQFHSSHSIPDSFWVFRIRLTLLRESPWAP